jgi:F0F1-type ATP synthase assembly protein I
VKEITMPQPSDGNDRNGPQQQPQKQPGDGVESSTPASPTSGSGGDSAGGSGWLESLAQRSTGLPEHQTRSSPESRKGDTSLWRLAGLGVQFAATTAIFAFMGIVLDKKMGWSPWGLVSLSLIAVIGNLYLLIKESLKQDITTKPGAKHVSPEPEKRSPPES